MKPRGRIIIMRGPDIALGPFLCQERPGKQTLRLVNVTTGQALVSEFRKDDYTPISQYRPNGLSPPFQPNHLGMFFMPFSKAFGFGRRLSMGNQHDFIGDLCVRLPIRRYTLLARKGRIVKSVKTKDPRDCVEYRSQAPDLVVEFNWETSDDFDMRIVEPDGTELSKFNTRTTAGKLTRDFAESNCQGVANSEQAIYSSSENIQTGEYRVIVTHFEGCRFGAVKYVLRATVRGKVVLTRSGQNDFNGRKVIENIKFRVTL